MHNVIYLTTKCQYLLIFVNCDDDDKDEDGGGQENDVRVLFILLMII